MRYESEFSISVACVFRRRRPSFNNRAGIKLNGDLFFMHVLYS